MTKPPKEKILNYRVNIPARHGPPPVQPPDRLAMIDEKALRGRFLYSLGIEPTLTDDELAEYSTQVFSSFEYFKPRQDSAAIPVVDWLKHQIENFKKEIAEAQALADADYADAMGKWENGHQAVAHVRVTDQTREKKVAMIESQPNFVEWLGEVDAPEAQWLELDTNRIKAEIMEQRQKTEAKAAQYNGYVVNYNNKDYTVMCFQDALDDIEFILGHPSYVRPAVDADMDMDAKIIITPSMFRGLLEGSSHQEKFLQLLELESQSELDVTDVPMTAPVKVEHNFQSLSPSEEILDFQAFQDSILDQLGQIMESGE